MVYRKLGRDSAHREAMLREMATQLTTSERIAITRARAKEIRRTAERMITLGKRGDLSAGRQAAAFVRNEITDVRQENDAVVVKSALQKSFSGIVPRRRDCNGGYTRIMRLATTRRGNGTPMVILGLVQF